MNSEAFNNSSYQLDFRTLAPRTCALMAPLLLLVSLIFLGCSARSPAAPAPLESRIETGDLIFLDLDCGELCDAIEDVTLEQFEVDGPRLSHVGIVERTSARKLFVVEAWPVGGVHRISLAEFLSRVREGENQPNGFYIGHFKPTYRLQAREAFLKVKDQIGKPYDDTFLLNNEKYYCSELIAEGFQKTRRKYFNCRPMFFGKTNSTAYKTWSDYYSKLGKKIPSQKPGISPLGMYLAGREKYFEN